jgi:hypothetical protein
MYYIIYEYKKPYTSDKIIVTKMTDLEHSSPTANVMFL